MNVYERQTGRGSLMSLNKLYNLKMPHVIKKG